MARSFTPSLSVLVPLLLLILDSALQLGLSVGAMAHSVGQENSPALTYEYQEGNFAEALRNGPEDKVDSWKVALTYVASLAGSHLNPYRLESEFIEEIVENIWKILKEEESATAPSRLKAKL
ncbi:hypothetical protein CMV_000799 [Castanea mollissima]|uniref:TIR domain-containing protein n=1 Tax=Castanea mollissima TaxID=60419 RepID=A0A8J4VYG6_9ROSI|nr:hypothetical protein CMV_000799 [Castanea mollissima]